MKERSDKSDRSSPTTLKGKNENVQIKGGAGATNLEESANKGATKKSQSHNQDVENVPEHDPSQDGRRYKGSKNPDGMNTDMDTSDKNKKE